MKRTQAVLILTLAAALASTGCKREAAPPAKPGASVNPAPAVTAAVGAAPDSFAPLVRRVSPAVVSIDTLAAGEFEGPNMGRGLMPGFEAEPVRHGAGSGFIIAPDGYVVTNNHVVENAREIVVSLADERQFPARLVGRDPPTDLAVLKIDARDLPYVSFARSALPEVGDWVVAVGNPFGLGGTATAGIVSARGREIGASWVSFLQIDAPINSGNSGGPSFDLRGNVVGVNTAIFSPSGGGSVGIGFAIPADQAEVVTRQLMQTGQVVRGYLGVGAADLTPAIAARLGVPGRRGALIVTVERGGPGAGALQPRDVVTAIGGREVAGAGDLIRAVAAAAPGSRLTLRVLRDGRTQDVAVTVTRRPTGA